MLTKSKLSIAPAFALILDKLACLILCAILFFFFLFSMLINLCNSMLYDPKCEQSRVVSVDKCGNSQIAITHGKEDDHSGRSANGPR